LTSSPHDIKGDIILNAINGRIEQGNNLISNLINTSTKIKEVLSQMGFATDYVITDRFKDYLLQSDLTDIEVGSFITDDYFQIIKNPAQLSTDTVIEIFDLISNEVNHPDNDLTFEKPEIFYIPKWSIKFKGKNKSYSRNVWANYCQYITNDINSCIEDISFDKKYEELIKKLRTFCICEICEGCFCNGHSIKIKNHYYCENCLKTS
jgi:hypothetical protein